MMPLTFAWFLAHFKQTLQCMIVYVANQDICDRGRTEHFKAGFNNINNTRSDSLEFVILPTSPVA